MEWITKDFLRNALRHHFKRQINIVKCATYVFLPIGENYTSDIIKISITYCFEDSNEHHDVCLVGKCFPKNEAMLDSIMDWGCFSTEIAVYSEILPAINNLNYLKKLAPIAIYQTLQPKPILLLEDLTKLDYKMHSRAVGLDLRHSLIVVEKLAYLHAASFAVFQKSPPIMNQYNKGLYCEQFSHFISGCFKSLIEVCEDFPELHQYANKLKDLQETIVFKVNSVLKPRGDFNILNHGDAWTNNMLFHYGQDGKVDDVVFVDFQFSIVSSPMIDLHYFWATSIEIDVKYSHQESIMNHYFQKLADSLKELRVTTRVPTRTEFEDDFKARAVHGFAAAIICLALSKANRRDDASLINFVKDNGKDSFRYDCFHNERYRKELDYLLPFYNSLGVFD